MQSLWSRVAEALNRCRRFHLHTGSHSALRRTPLRHRRPNCSKTFTAQYTTVRDPFAVFDAAYKDGPRPIDLDSAVGQRPPLPKQEQPAPGRRFAEEMRPWAPMGAIHALNSICDTEETLTKHMISQRGLETFLQTLHRSYDPLAKLSFHWHAEYLGPNLGAVQLAVDHEQREDKLPKREPMSALQFEHYHNMINKMVNSLIIQSYYDELPADPDRARRNVESLDSAWTAIRMLRSEGYPRYNHPSADPQATKKARDDLADKIRGLFEGWNTENPGSMAKFQVAKMCYNLLVCPVPPTMHHYNLLILGFVRKAAYNLVDIVAQSFFEDSRLRPTPQTVICLLIHYRRQKNIHGFYNVIRRMMAIDNRGMLIRRRWYEDVVKIPALHQWARRPEVTTSLQANWVIERPSRGQELYEALVSGLLSFDRIKDAVKVFVGSLNEGIGISIELFIFLLKHCRYSVDTSAADILSRGLIDNVDVVVSLLLRDDCPMKLTDHLYPVLTMTDPPSSALSEGRVRMLRNSSIMGVDPGDSGRVRRIKTAMFIRHTEAYLFRLERRLRSLKMLRRVQGHADMILVAQACTENLASLERRQTKLSGQVLKHQRLHRIVRELESLTWDLGSPETLAKTHGRIVSVLGNNLPRPLGYDAKYSSHNETEHLAMLATLADLWCHYRLRKMYGVMKSTRRMQLRAELVLLTGRRMMAEALALLHLPVDFGSQTLELFKQPQARTGNSREGQPGEIETEEGSLWPSAEAGAVLRAGPATIPASVWSRLLETRMKNPHRNGGQPAVVLDGGDL
ncbi:unnamed protein product [Discula destructiva]